MRLNRRNFVAGVGATVGTAGLASNVGADASIPVEIAQVYPVEDVVILENTGPESVDLGGYVMDWEYGSDPEQVDTIPSGTTIGAGEQLSVWTGFQSTQVPEIEADVQLDEYGNGRINASEVDVVALLTPSGEVVDQTEDTVNRDRVYDSGDYDGQQEVPDPEDVDGSASVTETNGDIEIVDHRFNPDDCTIEVTLENTSETYRWSTETQATAYDETGEIIPTGDLIAGVDPQQTLNSRLRFTASCEGLDSYSIETTGTDYEEADVYEEPEDVLQDVEFEYEYSLESYDDVYLEQRLEIRNGEAYIREVDNEWDVNYCYVTAEAENLTDDEDLTVYFSGRMGDQPTYELPTSIKAGETMDLLLEVIECPNDLDPDHASIRAWAPYVGEPHEEPEDYEPEDNHDEEEDDVDEKDNDCPDDEAESKDKKSKDDCPEEEPEPEPEPEDDC